MDNGSLCFSIEWRNFSMTNETKVTTLPSRSEISG